MRGWATRHLPALYAALALLLAACAKEEPAEQALAEQQAVALDTQTCAACGMVVREQPAPRGQAVHRDGTRQFFCSLADMVQYAEVPSPHGALTHAFVEVMTPADDPMTVDVAPRPWLPAERAGFVLGVERPRIMGPPVLAYPDAQQAAKAAAGHGGRVHGWAEVRREIMKKVHEPGAER